MSPEAAPTLVEVADVPPLQSTAGAPTVAISPIVSLKWFSALVVILVLILMGALASVYWWQRSIQTKPRLPAAARNTAPPTSKVTPSPDKSNPQKSPPIQPAGIKLDDFAGIWRAYEANDSQEIEVTLGNPENDLFIENRNGQLVLYPRKEKDQNHEINVACSPLQAATISCRVKDNGSSFTLKLELQPDKNEMLISEFPDEPSEIVILKPKRVG